jgi:hypothetical protein
LLVLCEKGDERGEGGDEHGRGTEFHDRRLYSEWRLLRGQVQRPSVASQFVTMVMGVFAPWSSGGDPAAWYPEEAWNQADPAGVYHCVKPPSARPV